MGSVHRHHEQKASGEINYPLSLAYEFKWWDILNDLYNHFVYNWKLGKIEYMRRVL